MQRIFSRESELAERGYAGREPALRTEQGQTRSDDFSRGSDRARVCSHHFGRYWCFLSHSKRLSRVFVLTTLRRYWYSTIALQWEHYRGPTIFSKRLPEQGFATFTRYWIEYALTTFTRYWGSTVALQCFFARDRKSKGLLLPFLEGIEGALSCTNDV